MKISELIKKLEVLKEKHGDNNLRFTVCDWYSRYGEEIKIDLRVGDTTGLPSDWNDVGTSGNQTTLMFHLGQNAEGKNAKITYRK